MRRWLACATVCFLALACGRRQAPAPAAHADADAAAPEPIAAPSIAPPSAPAASAGPIAIADLDPVALAGGRFHFGCEPRDADCSDDERPGRDATVAPMRMMRTEVTVALYARCVANGACTVPLTGGACNYGVAERARHPINCVDWTQADAFCRHVGGALPTAEEWEWAAKGGTSRIYPWGDDPPTDRHANFADLQFKKKYPRAFDVPGQDDGFVESAPVGSFPAGATPQGLFDMVGNVIEWTKSEYLPGQMEARGGGWATDTVSRRLRPSHRTGRAPSFSHATFGFRCRLPLTSPER